MFTVTLAEARRLAKHPKERQKLAGYYVAVYDPPEGGATPLDGQGKPRTSLVSADKVEAALEKGFTEEPVGAASSKGRGRVANG